MSESKDAMFEVSAPIPQFVSSSTLSGVLLCGGSALESTTWFVPRASPAEGTFTWILRSSLATTGDKPDKCIRTSAACIILDTWELYQVLKKKKVIVKNNTMIYVPRL